MKIELSSKDGKYKIYTETNNMKIVKDVKEYLRNTVYHNENNILVFYEDSKVEDTQKLESFSYLRFQFATAGELADKNNSEKEFINDENFQNDLVTINYINNNKDFENLNKRSIFYEDKTEKSKLIEECKVSKKYLFNNTIFDELNKDKLIEISKNSKDIYIEECKINDLFLKNTIESNLNNTIKDDLNMNKSNNNLIKIRILQDNTILHVDPKSIFFKNNKTYLIKERQKIIDFEEIISFIKKIQITKNDIIRILVFTLLLITNNTEIFFLIACIYFLQVFSKFIVKINKESLDTLRGPVVMFFMSMFIIDHGQIAN